MRLLLDPTVPALLAKLDALAEELAAGCVVSMRLSWPVPQPTPTPQRGRRSRGFLLRGAVFTTVDAPSSFRINADGAVVGFSVEAASTPHGLLLDDGTFTTIDDPHGVHGSLAHDLNERGDIVGFFFDAGGMAHGFLLTEGA